MGQYFNFFNFDKREKIHPFDYSNGLKVMEHSYQGNYFMSAVEKLMKTSWKGDRILYIGDYVDEYYDNPEYKDTLAELVKETNTDNLFNVDFRPIKIKLTDKDLHPTRYLYNHSTQEYVDLKKQPIQWSGYEKEEKYIWGTKIHPLSILLCASNGSGGSYYGKNMEYVGSWVNSLGMVEISDKKLDNDYKELNIIFDEQNTQKDNTQILKDTIKENIDNNNITNIETLSFDETLFLDESEKQELLEYAREYMFKDTLEFTEFLKNQEKSTIVLTNKSDRFIKVSYNENIIFLYRQFARYQNRMIEKDDMSFVGIYDKINNKVYGNSYYLDFLKKDNNDIQNKLAVYIGSISDIYEEINEKMSLKIYAFIENNKESLMKLAVPIFEKWKQLESNQSKMGCSVIDDYIHGAEIADYRYAYTKYDNNDVYDAIEYLEHPEQYLDNLYQEFINENNKKTLPRYNADDKHIEISPKEWLGFNLLETQERQRLLKEAIVDKSNPNLKKREVYAALKDSDTTNVTVTTVHNNKEITITYPTQILMSFEMYTNRINPVALREKFEELFSDVSKWGRKLDNEFIESISEIKYRNKTIYEDLSISENLTKENDIKEPNIEDDFEERDI